MNLNLTVHHTQDRLLDDKMQVKAILEKEENQLIPTMSLNPTDMVNMEGILIR